LNLFSKAFLAQHRLKLLFLIIWLHITALDLFYISYRGPVFLWKENAQFLTLLVHLVIALATVGLYWLLSKRAKAKFKTKTKLKTKANSQSDTKTNNKFSKNK
tara:strand:- start:2107 stop:2415 length:309 start_codon:yes stop_codon:yes gene_type:complete